MIIATRPGQTKTITLEAEKDLPASERSTFTIRTLDRRRTSELQNALVGYDQRTELIKVTPGTVAYQAVRHGLIEWAGVVDEDGNSVEPRFIKTGKGKGAKMLTVQSMDSLPQEVVDEIGEAVLDYNGIGSAAAKAEADDDPDATNEEDPNDPPE